MSGTNIGDSREIAQGDFNGDGLPDFVYSKSGESYLHVAYSQGNGTFSIVSTESFGVGNPDNSKFSLNVLDFNHDGLSDVVAIFEKSSNVNAVWLSSTGANLKKTNDYVKKRPEDATDGYIFTGDFDGDGKVELANYGSPLNSTSTTFDEKINIYKTGPNLAKEGLATKFTDGFGNYNTVEYNYATGPTVYKKTDAYEFPVHSYALPISVVSSVTGSGGAAGNQTVKYTSGHILRL